MSIHDLVIEKAIVDSSKNLTILTSSHDFKVFRCHNNDNYSLLSTTVIDICPTALLAVDSINYYIYNENREIARISRNLDFQFRNIIHPEGTNIYYLLTSETICQINPNKIQNDIYRSVNTGFVIQQTLVNHLNTSIPFFFSSNYFVYAFFENAVFCQIGSQSLLQPSPSINWYTISNDGYLLIHRIICKKNKHKLWRVQIDDKCQERLILGNVNKLLVNETFSMNDMPNESNAIISLNNYFYTWVINNYIMEFQIANKNINIIRYIQIIDNIFDPSCLYLISPGIFLFKTLNKDKSLQNEMDFDEQTTSSSSTNSVHSEVTRQREHFVHFDYEYFCRNSLEIKWLCSLHPFPFSIDVINKLIKINKDCIDCIVDEDVLYKLAINSRNVEFQNICIIKDDKELIFSKILDTREKQWEEKVKIPNKPMNKLPDPVKYTSVNYTKYDFILSPPDQETNNNSFKKRSLYSTGKAYYHTQLHYSPLLVDILNDISRFNTSTIYTTAINELYSVKTNYDVNTTYAQLIHELRLYNSYSLLNILFNNPPSILEIDNWRKLTRSRIQDEIELNLLDENLWIPLVKHIFI